MSAFDCNEVMREKGCVTLCKPAVGTGGRVFGFYTTMKEQGFDYTNQLRVTATNIDDRSANMAYIQISLLRIPGGVYHGDALSMEMRSTWVMPMRVTGKWSERLQDSAEGPQVDRPRLCGCHVNMFSHP